MPGKRKKRIVPYVAKIKFKFSYSVFLPFLSVSDNPARLIPFDSNLHFGSLLN